MKELFWIIAILILASCRAASLPSAEIRTVVSERWKDTTLYVTDSAAIEALVACDSAGQAYIREIARLKSGNKIQPPRVIIRNNVLTATQEIDSLAIYIAWREKDSASYEVRHPPPEYIEKPFTKWQLTQIWFGRLAFGGFFITMLYAIRKIFNFKF